jgi:ferredoxin-type protein NapH
LDRRNIFQIIYSALTNSNIFGFVKGNIYKGKSKKICVPGLNCYSCPGALGACPLGSFQSMIAGAEYKISLYVLGLVSLFGVLIGRLICGWLCPFGLVQDLLYKIKTKKIKVKNSVHNKMKYLKYVILIVFVILMPLFLKNDFGISSPYFCKLICPAGTLGGGIPLALANKSIRNATGSIFAWKVFVLILVLISSVLIYRPFCKYLCPLGAFYSFFNKISFYRYSIDKDKCIDCGICEKTCKMNVKVFESPNSAECIRCGECKKNCPTKAIKSEFKF